MSKRLLKKVLRLLLLVAATTPFFAQSSVLQVRYWDWGITPERDDFEIAVLRAALENTKPEFGGYQLDRVVRDFTTQRVRRELVRGEIINVQPGPWRVLDDSDPDNKPLRVDVDFFEGLLGYRRLYVLKNDLPRFTPAPREEPLRNLTVGQVKGWVDVDIYKYNGYKVNDEANLTTLFEMLRVGRFDYVAMSAAEQKSVLGTERSVDVATVPGILIYYSLPMVFYVSPTEPTLAKRLAVGMAHIKQTGELHKIFLTHYGELVKQLKLELPVIYRLENPNIPEQAKKLISHELL